MALLADRVKETTTTTGTGTVSLAGAPAGFQSFNTAFANGSLVYYVIQGGAEWEIGIGTTGTGTLARTQVLQSSNADALVPFSAGVKDVFCSYVADRAVTTVDAATLTNKTLDDYTNNIGANSTHFRIKATGTLSKGTVVKATGYNPGENAIEVAVVTSATDLVLGISEQALTAGQFGLAVVIGELMDVNTNGLTVGGIIYSNGSGGFTQTKPSSGTYQPLGWVVRANTSNGVIAVNIVAPLYVETATNTANTSVLRDGSGNFAAGTITATLSGTATQVSNALTAGTYLTSGGTYNGSAARTFAVDATDANTASKVVARDASGNFSAGTITAALTGNASTATALQTARNINGVAFNGTADITVTAAAGTLTGTTLASGVTASSLTSVGTLSSLTVSGNLTVDTNTLFVDAVNNSVGIGTVGPAAQLHIAGSTASTLKSILAQGASDAAFALVSRNGSGSSAGTEQARFGMEYLGSGVAAGFSFVRGSSATDASLSIITNTATRATFDANGNLAVDTNTLYVDAANNRVGVGTASPGATAHIVDPAATLNGTVWFGSNATFQGRITYDGTTNGQFIFQNRYDSANIESGFLFQTRTAGTPVDVMKITGTGNLGLGVTPSAWSASFKALQIGGGTALWTSSNGTFLSQNNYNDGSNKYINTGHATRYYQLLGAHIWETAPSGTAGNAITFTQAMTLDASGNVSVGGTAGGNRLRVTSADNSGATTIAKFESNNGNQATLIRFASVLGENGDFTTGTLTNHNYILSSNNTERARIDTSGNLGIGETSPSTYGRLVVAKSGPSVIYNRETSVGVNSSWTSSDGSLVIFGAVSNHPLTFITNNTERARIGANGKWTVDSSISGDVIVNLVNSNSNGFGLRVAGGGANYIASFNDYTGAERMRIDGTTTAGQTALLLWDVDNGTLERVTVGAADSGGTGFKVLRIPN